MAVCRSRGVGAYVASEVHNVVWGRLAKPGARAVLELQGSHGLADSNLTTDSLDRTNALAEAGYLVMMGDLSQTLTQGTFGNPTVVTRTGQLRTFVQGASSPVPAAGKVHLMGGSGGATAAINYARANPTLVASMYLIVPMTDIEDVYNNHVDASITKSEINKAYNNGVDDGGTAFAAAMPASNPARSGNVNALAGIPMRIAYSTNDPYIDVTVLQNWVAAANAAGAQTSAYSQGPIGHSGVGVDPQDVVNFFRAHP